MIFTICDDEAIQRKTLHDMILSCRPDAEILECSTAEEAVSCSGRSQIVFLDIDTGSGMDGMEAAKVIYQKYSEGGSLYSLPLLIFTTGYPERMQEAFGVHAFYFLTKPVKRQEFLPVLREAVSVAEKLLTKEKVSAADDRSLVIRTNAKTFTVPIRKILYVESDGRTQRFHVLENASGSETEVISTLGSFAEIEGQLDSRFCRIHRSFLVNLSFVRKYDRSGVELTDGSSLLISKYKYKEFVNRYMSYMGSGI